MSNFRPLSEIAMDISMDWKNVSPYAVPYLTAMHTLNSIYDAYYMDDAESIVLYFLSNATSWKGETARAVKKELKEMCDYKRKNPGSVLRSIFLY